MVDPVLADDDNTYDRSAILEHLKTNDKSPVDRSTVVNSNTLRFNKAVYETIEQLVAAGNLPEALSKSWYARGKGEKMFKEGRIVEAADLGHAAAMGIMAQRYYRGTGGVEEDNDKAFAFATRAAEGGDALGMFVLGECNEEGYGVAVDKVAGLKWYEESAKKGNIDAMNSSGQCYSAGAACWCVKDDKKAAAYFKSASEQGHEFATHELANCYYEGAGVAKNLTTARTLFKRVAEKENADGEFNLGVMMILGEGGPEEIGKGFALVEKAAKAQQAGDLFVADYLVYIKGAVKKWKKKGIFKLGTT